MFRPTHVLVSRSRQTPVQLIPGTRGYHLQTEQEWQNGCAPAFEMNAKLGFFCKGIPVVGYRLQPVATVFEECSAASNEVATGS
jgi:hypothetical protein